MGSAALLGLALLSAFVACKRWYLFLWLTGFAAYMALALAFLLHVYLAGIASEPAQPVAARPNLFWYSPRDNYEFGIGWYIAIAGILLLFAGAVVDGILDSQRPALRYRTEPLTGWPRNDPWWVQLHSRGGSVGEG
jgi:hypothetical protein